jgi:hypothetical protein
MDIFSPLHVSLIRSERGRLRRPVALEAGDEGLVIKISGETEIVLTVVEPAALAGVYGPFDLEALDTGPINALAPTVSGAAAPGATLTAQSGVWIYAAEEPAPIFTMNWLRNGVSVGTTPDRVLVDADLSDGLDLEIVASTASGSRSTRVGAVPRRFPAIVRLADYVLQTPTTQESYTKFTLALRAGFNPAPATFSNFFRAADNRGAFLAFKGTPQVVFSINDGAGARVADILSSRTIDTPGAPVSMIASFDLEASGDLGAGVVAALRMSGESTLRASGAGGGTPIRTPAAGGFILASAVDLHVHDFVWLSWGAALDPDDPAIWSAFFDPAADDAARDFVESRSLTVAGVMPDLAMAGSVSKWAEGLNLGSASTAPFGGFGSIVEAA